MRTAFPLEVTNSLVLNFLMKIVIKYEIKQIIRVLPQKAINCSTDVLTKLINDIIVAISKNCILSEDIHFDNILII